MALTAADVTLAQSWAKAGRKLRKAVPRGDRDRFDALVLDLVGHARSGEPPWPPEHDRAILGIGVSTAAALAKECADTELLAAAVALPWYDSALLRSRSPLLTPGRPLDWAGVLVLAMAPAGRRFRATGGRPPAGPYLRQLSALPPLLRGVVAMERAFAGAAVADPRLRLPATARPFDDAELEQLGTGVPARLLPPAGPPAPPAAPPPAPVGSPAEAIALVRRQKWKFGAYRMTVDGEPKYLVESAELAYQVRWDTPPEAIRTVGSPAPDPGDRETVRFREPGWIVDRVSGEVHAVDLASPSLRQYTSARRVFPLPPGWRLEPRPPVPDGLAAAAPPPVHDAAAVLREAATRYTGLLTTETWPDFLVAWRVGLETVRALTGTGSGNPESTTAALLAARGTAPADTLVDEESPSWRTPAGELARSARPDPDETDGPGAARRADRLAGAPGPTRALVVANARARLVVEGELFGMVPRARRDEVAALAALAGPDPTAAR